MSENTTEQIHCSAVNVAGIGVLLNGNSGAGKSTLAFQLLRRGHRLIGDDAVVLTNRNGKLFSKGHERIRGQLHLRDHGVIDITSMMGSAAVVSESQISFFVEVYSEKPGQNENASEKIGTWRICGVELPGLRAYPRNLDLLADDIEHFAERMTCSEK